MSEEMNDIDLGAVAEFLEDEIKVLEKYNAKAIIYPADTRRITLATERIGVAIKIVVKRVARIEDFLQIPENFE